MNNPEGKLVIVQHQSKKRHIYSTYKHCKYTLQYLAEVAEKKQDLTNAMHHSSVEGTGDSATTHLVSQIIK